MCLYVFLCVSPRVVQHLDKLVQGKELQLEQTSTVSRNLQTLRQEVEERLGRSLRERDSIISQLQASLQTHSKEAQVPLLQRLLVHLKSLISLMDPLHKAHCMKTCQQYCSVPLWYAFSLKKGLFKKWPS